MQQIPEVERLLIDIDRIVAAYAGSNDRKIKKLLHKLKRLRKKFDARDAASIIFKIGWIADKLNDHFDLFS